MPKGYLAIVLHAHLPYVRHPEHPNFLEELWFFEAMAETYLPLIKILSRLEDDNVGYKLLLSLSPTLTTMMEDPLLQSRFRRHLDKTIRLADAQMAKSPAGGDRHRLAAFYGDYYRDILFWFEEKCGRHPCRILAELAELGNLDLMTCGATHGFFPILQQNPGAITAQLACARQHHTATFGIPPEGIWIPECAYFPGVEKALAAHGFAYSFVDTHGMENASVAPARGVYAPVCTPEGVAFFGRDRETSYQVWSAEQGYPGHPDYREFYRDLGFELPEEELRDFIIDGSIRINTGLKMSRITSRHSGEKAPYNPDAAREQAARHAAHFLENRMRQTERLAAEMPGRPPLIVAPYDAELYGHWWFEGPQFLDYVLRKMHYDQDTVKCMTPAEYLLAYPENQLSQPAGSSWGGDGTYEFWVSPANQDVIPGLHKAAEALTALVDEGRHDREALKQMTRELMLAQASDWPFIMRTGTSPGYAKKRVHDHLNRFWALAAMLRSGEIDRQTFTAICQADAIFPECRPEWYSSGGNSSLQ